METGTVAKRRWRFRGGPRTSFATWVGYVAIALIGLGAPVWLMMDRPTDGRLYVVWNVVLFSLQGLAAFLEIPGLVRRIATPLAHEPVTALDRRAERDRRELPQAVRRAWWRGI